MEMNRVKINGIEMAYAHRGRGKPVVLLHGYPLDHHLWDEISPWLEDDFELILPDLRGFGESTTLDAVYTMEDFAADIAGLLDHLSLPKAAIVGHSMGGYIALAFANRYAARTSGLGLLSSQALADSEEKKEGRYRSADEISQKGIGGVVDFMAEKFTSNVGLQMTSRQMMKRQNPAALIGALKAMAERNDCVALISTFKFPVVLVHGDADVLIPIDRAREMKSVLPSAFLTELAGVGHIPMLEAPERTAEALMLLK